MFDAFSGPFGLLKWSMTIFDAFFVMGIFALPWNDLVLHWHRWGSGKKYAKARGSFIWWTYANLITWLLMEILLITRITKYMTGSHEVAFRLHALFVLLCGASAITTYRSYEKNDGIPGYLGVFMLWISGIALAVNIFLMITAVP